MQTLGTSTLLLLLFHRSVVSNSLQTHGLQHTRLPCPSPTPGACANSGPLSWWYHSSILSSFILFSCPQFFPASGSFPMSRLFASYGQSFGASASASVLLMNSQDWFPLRLIGLISSQSKGLSRVFSSTIECYLASNRDLQNDNHDGGDSNTYSDDF